MTDEELKQAIETAVNNAVCSLQEQIAQVQNQQEKEETQVNEPSDSVKEWIEAKKHATEHHTGKALNEAGNKPAAAVTGKEV